jgi:hypothetical protein
MNISFSMKDTNGNLVPITDEPALDDRRVVTITVFGSEAEASDVTALAGRIARTELYELRASGEVPTKDGTIRCFSRLVRKDLGVARVLSELTRLGV